MIILVGISDGGCAAKICASAFNLYNTRILLNTARAMSTAKLDPLCGDLPSSINWPAKFWHRANFISIYPPQQPRARCLLHSARRRRRHTDSLRGAPSIHRPCCHRPCCHRPCYHRPSSRARPDGP